MDINIVDKLVQKGVNIPNPESVFISDTININRISSDNVTIHAGCKLFGEHTLIMGGCQLGYEAPVTLENSFVGPNCRLYGGFFKQAVFVGDNVFGSGAHVREGTILEEQANAAHTVGLKQSILFPFVTLGSLINFCDCFMAGGTDRKNHSEVGSSFIHFNYTPNQDKATASMMGNIHQGVMLDQAPIFLGGQGGLVGPVRIAFGCLSAAGSIIRKNEERPDRLLLGGGFKNISFPRQPKVYKNINFIYDNNIKYIAGLICLKYWYAHIRKIFMGNEPAMFLHQGMLGNLDSCIDERIKRLDDFKDKLLLSRQIHESESKDTLLKTIESHNQVIQAIKNAVGVFKGAKTRCLEHNGNGDKFIDIIKTRATSNTTYLDVIQGLSDQEKEHGRHWLHTIENELVESLNIEQE